MTTSPATYGLLTLKIRITRPLHPHLIATTCFTHGLSGTKIIALGLHQLVFFPNNQHKTMLELHGIIHLSKHGKATGLNRREIPVFHMAQDCERLQHDVGV